MRLSTGAAHKNIAIGLQAGYCASGSYNIFFGCGAGELVTTGSRNIIIGCGVDAPSATGNRQLAIGEGTGRWIAGDSSFNTTLAGITTAKSDGTFLVGAGVTLHARGEAAFAGVVTFSAPTTNSNVKGAINLPYNRYITFGQDYIRGAIYHTGTQLYIQSLNAFKFRVWDGNGLKDWLNVIGVGGQVQIGGCDMGVTGSNKTHMFRLNKHKITMCSSVPDSSTQTKRFELDLSLIHI